MAELELVVRHRTVPAKVGLYALVVTMPLWSIAAPFLLGSLIGTIGYSILHPNEAPMIVEPMIEIAVIIILALIPVLAILMCAVCEDDRILISKEGLFFPLGMFQRLGFRRDRAWSDLSTARLQGQPVANGRGGFEQGLLQLHFRSGPSVPLSLELIDKSSLEQFFLALEIWGKNCERAPELIAYQSNLQNESRGLGHATYTQMWEEELGRRFSATSFVPLEPDHRLADKTIRIVRQLAFGGLSAIYLAQKNEKELVVIKEAVIPVNADQRSRLKALEMFKREAKFLEKLDHPKIAKVLDHFQDEGRNYLVLEYVAGQDLRQYVKQNGKLEEALAVKYFRQLSEILAYLHTQEPPIIHRDLTPDNVVMKNKDEIVLIDFGAANEFLGTATGTMVGKQSYIAPEQLRGKTTISSDIYALGCTIYFLLTGIDPEALSESHPRLSESTVSTFIDELVGQCTAMEEADRPLSARQICQLIDSSAPGDFSAAAAAAAAAGKGQAE